MKRQISIILFFMMISSHMGYTQDLSPQSTSHTGYVLRYGRIKGKKWLYKIASNQTEELQIPKIGMDLNSQLSVEKKCTLHFISQNKNMHLLASVLINDMTVQHSGPGRTEEEVPEINGRTFNLLMTPFGLVTEYIGVDGLKAKSTGISSEAGIENNLLDIFLNLPEEAIRSGDEWEKKGSHTSVNQDGIEQTVVYTALCTFEGLEKLDDRNCLKIKIDRKGTVTGAGSKGPQGSYREFNGTFECAGMAYFDPDYGIVRKLVTNTITTGKMTIWDYFGQYVEPFKKQEKIEMRIIP